MNLPAQLNGTYTRLPTALDLLQRRAIRPERDVYTTRQLARELARRGWHWDLGAEEASAAKAYAPPGTVSQTVRVQGPDQLTNLILVLADVIRFDEEHGYTVRKPYRADIVVRAQDGRVIALVEVRNSMNLSSDTAVAFRRDLLADHLLDESLPFFLIASQDWGYIWDRSARDQPFATPAKQFPLQAVASHYLPWFDPQLRLSSQELEIALARWLSDIAERRVDRPKNADRFFDDTGFLDAIGGATVEAGLRV